MRKKYLVTAGAMALSMGLLAGCGAPKADQFVDKMMENAEDSFAATVDMDVDVSVDFGMAVDLSANGGIEMEYDGSDKDAPAVHFTTDLSYAAMGQKGDLNTEAYSISDGDTVIAYAKDPDSGDWIKTEQEVKENPLDEETMNKIREASADVMKQGEVEKKAVKVNGEDCWVLKLDTTADAYMPVYDILLEAAGDEAEDALEETGVDNQTIESYLSYFNMDMTVYASKKTGRCVKMEIDMSGSDMEGLLDQVNEDFGDQMGGFIDLSTVSVELNAISFTVEFTEWGDVTVEVPDDVAEKATDMGSAFNTDDEEIGWDVEDTDAEVNTDADADIDLNATPDTDSDASGNDELSINSDGSVSLYDYDNNYICDVKVRDGFELDEDFSVPTYLSFDGTGSGYKTYSIYPGLWLDWDDVVAEGELHEEDDGDYYVVFGENDDKQTTVKSVIDLGIERDGYPVYATCDAIMNADNSGFEYSTYTLAFRVDDDDNWVEVYLYEDDIEDWSADQFKEVYEEIFE